MRGRAIRVAVLVALAAFCAGAITAQDMKKPEPTVPEIFTLTRELVRIAYNNEGYVTLGYRIANASVAEEWMLLDVGVTLRDGNKSQTMKRDAFTLMLPDGSTIPLATQKEYNKAGSLRALNARANMTRDSINYFPVSANQACVLGFFADPTGPSRISYDQFELTMRRACVGRMFFEVPGKIQTGQYYLNVKFEGSMVQVPFRILTKAEEKEFKKQWQDIKKEHDESYKE
ncbi:MAG: hypothetical protein QNL88_05590 [Acidobacteriota bacterium]|nr:hypothetical protein [Acidobacteriota bacterium]